MNKFKTANYNVRKMYKIQQIQIITAAETNWYLIAFACII